MHQNKTKELLYNTVVFAVGGFGSKILNYFLIPLYTIYLSTAEYGTADLLTSTTSMIIPLLSLCMGHAVLRFVLGKTENRQTALLLVFAITLGGLIFLFLLYPFLNRVSAYQGYAWYLPLLFFVSALHTILGSYCKAIEKNKTLAFDGILAAVSQTVLSLLFIAVWKLGVDGYLSALLISRAISVLYFVITCSVWREFSVKPTFHKQVAKAMLQFSVPLIPGDLSWWVIQMSDRYMLVFLSGAAINGLYSMAYKIPGIFNIIVSVFMASFSITAIKEYENREEKNGKLDGSYLELVYRKYLMVTFIAVSALILLTRPIASVFFKKDFFDAWVYVPLLLCAFTIGNLQAFYESVVLGLKKTKLCFFATFGGAITNVVLNFLLIPRYSAYGAATATAISYLAVYIIKVIGCKKYVEMNHHFGIITVSLLLVLLIGVLYMQGELITDFVCVVLVGVIILLYWKEVEETCKYLYSMIRRLIRKSME